MSDQIPAVYVQGFKDSILHYCQQEGSKLLDTVTMRQSSALAENWEKIGIAEVSAKGSSRPVATPVEDIEFKRVQSQALTYHLGELVEHEDQLKAMVSLQSNLMKSMGNGVGRGYDREIIRALEGTARTAGAAGTFTDEALPVGKTTTTGAVITFQDIQTLNQKFMEREIMPTDEKFLVVSPAQVTALLNVAQATNSDFISSRGHLNNLNETGVVDNFMGFNWIVSNLLTQDQDTGASSCLAYTREALGMQMNEMVATRIAEDPSNSFAYRLYATSTYGAVRYDNDRMEVLKVLNAAA